MRRLARQYKAHFGERLVYHPPHEATGAGFQALGRHIRNLDPWPWPPSRHRSPSRLGLALGRIPTLAAVVDSVAALAAVDPRPNRAAEFRASERVGNLEFCRRARRWHRPRVQDANRFLARRAQRPDFPAATGRRAGHSHDLAQRVHQGEPASMMRRCPTSAHSHTATRRLTTHAVIYDPYRARRRARRGDP